MLKYLCLIALLPLPTWEYKIKVEGKLDIGNQIASFLKEIRTRVMEQKMRALSKGTRSGPEIGTEHGKNEKEKQETKTENETMSSIVELSNKGEDEELPLLDEMIKSGQKQMHLYGKHKSEEDSERNNVYV